MSIALLVVPDFLLIAFGALFARGKATHAWWHGVKPVALPALALAG